MQYYVKEDNIKEVDLYIHKDLIVETVTCNGLDRFSVGESIAGFSPFILESKRIKLNFDKSLSKGDKLDIYFKYSG